MQMSDTLNWAHRVAPGVVLCKDEGFLAGWELIGLDSESIDPVELNAILGRVARGVSELMEGDALWVTLWRARAMPAGLDPDHASRLPAAVQLLLADNQELSKHELLFENKIHIVFRSRPDEDSSDLMRRVETFERRCAAVEAVIGNAFALYRLGVNEVELPSGAKFQTDALADLLASMAAVRPVQQRMGSQQDICLDVALGADFGQSGFEAVPTIDDHEVALISIETWPEEYTLDALSVLETLPFDYRWTVRYVVQSPTKTRAVVNSLRRKWRQSGSNLLANAAGQASNDRDLHADIMAQGLAGVSLDLGRGLRYGYLTSTIILRADDPQSDSAEMRQNISAVEQVLLANGFRGRRERINAREAYLGSLPGHMMMMARASSMSAFNFASLIPYRSFWNGESVCPSNKFPPNSPPLLLAHSARGELFQLNLHVGDVGHTVIAGPTGAGKSVLLGGLAAQWLKYPKAQVFYFDKHCSSRHLCNALDGSFIEFGHEAGQGLAPLGDLEEVGLEWAKTWIQMLGRLANPSISEVTLGELASGVDLLARHGGGALKELTTFGFEQEGRAAVEKFAGKGKVKRILGGDSDSIAWKPFTVFEAQELFEYDEATSLLALSYIFRRCEQRFDGRPTLVVFDEAAAFLRHDVFREKIAEWLREARKKNVAVVMATQNVSDFIGSGIVDSFENVNTYMFLPNARATTEKSAAAYRNFGLSDTQIEIISGLEPKREYYIVKPQGARIVDFKFGPVGLKLLSQTDKEDSDRAKAAAKTNRYYWMEELHAVAPFEPTDISQGDVNHD